MKRALPALAATALLVALTGVATTTGAAAATQHCADHRTATKIEVPEGGTTQVVHVDGQAVTVVVDGDDVSFSRADGSPVYGVFCVKAGTSAQDGAGTTGSSGSVYGPGKDISYVVLYRLQLS